MWEHRSNNSLTCKVHFQIQFSERTNKTRPGGVKYTLPVPSVFEQLPTDHTAVQAATRKHRASSFSLMCNKPAYY